MFDLGSRLQAALVDRYVVERELGRGGMSIVYLARDLRHDRLVALKVLRPELAASLGPERFLREIKLAAGLAHPHILPLHDSGDADGLLYYVMPYVEGESLRQRLQREARLPLDAALQIAREVADALAHAHKHDIVHRDIKPENILLQAGHAVVSDFGVARAISAAAGARVTMAGTAVGTPAYMSPEQASGEMQVDGRSDIYSLGCVLYEMLVGNPPFTASGVDELLGAHRAERAPAVSGARVGVPMEVELAVEHALAKRPDERFQSASEFAAALAVPGFATVSGERRRRARRRWWAGIAAAVVLGGVAVAVVPQFLRAGLDESLYVVVPFGHRAGAAPKLLDGDQCESLLYQEFGRWQDVRLVDESLVHDYLLRHELTQLDLSSALGLARELGAGRLVWGEVSAVGDTTQVRASLYDAGRRRAPLREHLVRFGSDLRDAPARFGDLADSLLLGHVRSPEAAAGVAGTRVLAAFEAFLDGHEAWGAWDLAAAEQSFRRALEFDPAYPHAHLWLAQTSLWAGRPAADWRTNAAAAAAADSVLGPRDRILAQALLSLADGQYPQACARYRQLVARDTLDPAAWLGLGECQARDKVVQRDPRSPSGWRFRSSLHAAADAYRHALLLVPSVHRAFAGLGADRLTHLFIIENNVVRDGYAAPPDTVRYAAFPALDHDTTAYTPFPVAQVFGGRPEANPSSRSAAVDRNRETLREITTTWVRVFPASADARETLALVLEALGELPPAQPDERSALEMIRRARGLARLRFQQLRLTAAEVRVLVKLGEFARARELADSVLRVSDRVSPARPTPLEASQLAGLAALTGQVHEAARLLELTAPIDSPSTWDGQFVTAPLQVKQAWLKLLGYAALGAPSDSIRVLARRAEQQVNSWIARGERERVRNAVLHVPAALAFPAVGLSPVHRREAGGNYLLEMQWALAHGDTAWVRAELTRIRALRSARRPGDVAIDGTYGEALVLLALADTAAATQLLDLSLDALPTLGTYLLEQVPQAGGLVRAMVLRADLAARAGDQATAARWARAVLTLWAKADPPLEPVLERMRPFSEPARQN